MARWHGFAARPPVGEEAHEDKIPAHLRSLPKVCPRNGCRSSAVYFRYFNNKDKKAYSEPRYACRVCKRLFTLGGRQYSNANCNLANQSEEKNPVHSTSPTRSARDPGKPPLPRRIIWRVNRPAGGREVDGSDERENVGPPAEPQSWEQKMGAIAMRRHATLSLQDLHERFLPAPSNHSSDGAGQDSVKAGGLSDPEAHFVPRRSRGLEQLRLPVEEMEWATEAEDDEIRATDMEIDADAAHADPHGRQDAHHRREVDDELVWGRRRRRDHNGRAREGADLNEPRKLEAEALSKDIGLQLEMGLAQKRALREKLSQGMESGNGVVALRAAELEAFDSDGLNGRQTLGGLVRKHAKKKGGKYVLSRASFDPLVVELDELIEEAKLTLESLQELESAINTVNAASMTSFESRMLQEHMQNVHKLMQE